MGRKKGAYLQAEKVREIRLSMHLDIKSMAIFCGMEYTTYQDYEYGRRGVSKEVAEVILGAQERNQQTMAGIMSKISAMVDKQYPHGIKSEVEIA